jgi:TolA-binding protein
MTLLDPGEESNVVKVETGKAEAGILQENKASECVAVVESVLDDISKGLVQNASAKLQRLREDSDHFIAEAEQLISRLVKVENRYISKGEKAFIEIGNLGRKESDLRSEKGNEEARLEGKRSVLRDNESRLSSAEHGHKNAQQELERRKRDKENSVATGAYIGAAVLGIFTFGIGAAVGAAIGAGVSAGVGAAVSDREVSEARDKVARLERECGRARSAVQESERQVASMQAQMDDLNGRIEKLKKERLSCHEIVDGIKQSIILLKDSIKFWGLFKQASEHSGHHTSFLEEIVNRANEEGDYYILRSEGSKRVTTTFIEAVEEMVSPAKEGCSSHILQIEFSCTYCGGNYTELPYVDGKSQFVCVKCNGQYAIQDLSVVSD